METAHADPGHLRRIAYCSIVGIVAAALLALVPISALAAGWTIVSSPNNNGSGTQPNTLTSVTCASASVCWAVGDYVNGSGYKQTLIEEWAGSSWTIVSSPNTFSTANNTLSGVACASLSECWAVGQSASVISTQGLIEEWDGSSWSIVSSPSQGFDLLSVTCASASECWAVGNQGYSPVQTLIEEWDGSSWTVVTSPSGGTTGGDSFLNGVTCAAASECWAVGYVHRGGGYPDQALIEEWAGISWTAVTSPSGETLNAVTCASAAECWAVGQAPGVTCCAMQTLIEEWNGSFWAIVSSPNNGNGSASQPNDLLGVSCAAASECEAVGNAVGNAVGQTLVEAWDGSSWSIVTSPNTSTSQANDLSGVICAPASECWAVGEYTNGSAVNQTLVEEYLPAAVLPAAAVFPAMANGAYGGYVTAATIQNTGTAPATIRIDYYDQNGSPVGAGDSISNLQVNGSWTVRQDNGNSFPSTGGNAAQAGSAVVYSSQPIASFVNEFAPGNVGDATSYSGVQVASGVGTTLYAPTIVNNAYGGYTTGIGLLNEGSSATNVTITYRDGGGALIKTQTVPALAAHAYHALYSGDTTLALPSGFAGTATMTSSTGQPLGAIVNETGPGGQFSSYDAVPSGSTTLFAPAALNNAFGGYYTGMGIQNTSASAGTVSVTYYDASGTPTVKSFTIAAYGSLGVYQGSATDGPPVGAYTAVIQSTLPLATIVNEVASSSGSAQQSTSYNTFSAGSATLHLPLAENAGSDPWNTGEGIMNTGTGSTTVTVNYYNTATGASVGSPQTQTLAANAFWGLYQPNGGLPSGTRATAVITTSSGGQAAVICNESSTTTFMSYDGQ